MAELFRKSALDRLATPEQLDRALLTTTANAWLALVTLMAMAAAVLVWSIVGTVSTFASANGILLNRGGIVVDAVSSNSGTLTTIIPAIGDYVESGSVVAESTHRETAERYRSARAAVDERTRALADEHARAAAADALIEGNLARQRQRLSQLEQSARQSIEAARTRLEDHRRLFAEGVITRVSVERSQQAFDQAQRELFDVTRRRDDLDSQELRRQHDQNVRIAAAEARLRTAENQANELMISLETRRIPAPASGRVIEHKASVGTVLRPGQPLLSIETAGGGLEALVYVPPSDGKRVEPGMRVLVSPVTVRRESSGAILGAVASVSEFPVSLDGMVAVLQNRDLAQNFSRSGPPHASRVVLVADPTTASGFAWTSPKGAETTLTSGTLVSVEVEVASKAPIELVVPLVKELLGL